MKVLSLILSATVLALSKAPTAEQFTNKDVKGDNVVKVEHANGYFEDLKNQKWVQIILPVGSAQYREIGRDEWSVYLRNDAKKTDIQLDLWVKKTFITTATSPRREQFKITNALRLKDLVTTGVNGPNVYRVVYDGGVYVDQGGLKWIEKTTQNGNFEFTEVARDEWSVYLRDESRKVDLQLDLWVRKVFYADAHTPRREQYLITNAFRFE